jgi:hypothetical protein
MYKVWNGSRACKRYRMGAEHVKGMEWEQSMWKVWNGSRAWIRYGMGAEHV